MAQALDPNTATRGMGMPLAPSVIAGARGYGTAAPISQAPAAPAPATQADLQQPLFPASSTVARLADASRAANASGNTAGALGLTVGAGLAGLAYGVSAPAVAAWDHVAAAGDAVKRFAGGVFGSTDAAALPAQVAAPVAATPAGAVATLPALSPEQAAIKAAAFQAQPGVLAGRWGDWTPGSTATHGIVPGPMGTVAPAPTSIVVPGAAPAAHQMLPVESAAMLPRPGAVAPQAGLPIQVAGAGAPVQSEYEKAIGAPAGFVNHLLRVTPRSQLPGLLTTLGQNKIAQENQTAKNSTIDYINSQYAAGMAPKAGETPAQAAAREAATKEEYFRQISAMTNPLGAQAGLVNGAYGMGR